MLSKIFGPASDVAGRWALVLCVSLISVFLASPPAEACTILSSGTCGGKDCPKGKTCQRAADGLSCRCVNNKALEVESVCEQARGTLRDLLGTSDFEIRLEAAKALLDHGCSGCGAAPLLSASPACVEPALQQFKACAASCKANSPEVPACFDGCAEVYGAVLEGCPAASSAPARNECGDCLADCSESRYECFQDCRQQEPWDPDCYDDCEDIDCGEECEDVC